MAEDGSKIMGTISFLIGVTLVIYAVKFVQKTDRLGSFLAVVGVVGLPRWAEACAVCFGNPDAPETRGASSAILFLLVITLGVLIGMATFFFYLMKTARAANTVDTASSQPEKERVF